MQEETFDGGMDDSSCVADILPNVIVLSMSLRVFLDKINIQISKTMAASEASELSALRHVTNAQSILEKS